MDSDIPTPSGFKSCCSHYFWIYFRISGDALSLGEDVPIDDEAPTDAKKSSMDGVEPPLHTSVTDELVQERVRTTWGRPCLYSICKVVSTWAGLHHPKINKRTRKGTGPHFGSNLEAESDGSDSYFHSKL